ncbi:MAG: hypothetical protein H0U24_02225 [Thermoleophilaceae bacterium]|nr:hypothetical protein [Thermoleophilaceae bacterium]
MGDTPITKFTLRFRNPRNHELLGFVADRFGVTKNQLAEEMLERELSAAALLLERDLAGTLDLLRSYRRDERIDADIQAFAEGEAYGEDPLKSRMLEQGGPRDSLGVLDAFSS